MVNHWMRVERPHKGVHWFFSLVPSRAARNHHGNTMSKKSTRRASTGAKTAAVTRSTQESLATLHRCYDWLYYTYASEMAQLARLNASVRLGAVCVEGEALDHHSQIALTVEDRMVNGEFSDGLTFTFLDASHPQVQFGSVAFASFVAMARRFFKDLPTIQSLYQARAVYVAATGASPAQALPDVGGQESGQGGAVALDWFRGATRPKLDETSSYYSLPQLAAMAHAYLQQADNAVAERTPAPTRPTPSQTGRRRTAPPVSYLRQKLAVAAAKSRLHPRS